jgi:hypothetical protein
MQDLRKRAADKPPGGFAADRTARFMHSDRQMTPAQRRRHLLDLFGMGPREF